MQRYIVSFSENADEKKALEENCTKICGCNNCAQPILIIFSSDTEGFEFYSRSLKSRFPSSTVIGCTTYSVFSSCGTASRGLSCLSVFDGIECSSGVLLEITRNPMKYRSCVTQALSSLSSYENNSYENTCCLEFTTALSRAEELVQDTLSDALSRTRIRTFGSSGGCMPSEKKTYVSLNGTVYDEACVFVLVHNTRGKIFLYRENIYSPTANKFTATSVDCEERTVYEYNGRVAADVLSRALTVPRDRLSEALFTHPMGREIDGDIYITDFDRVNEDGSISYFSRIYGYTKMILLEPDNAQRVWRETKSAVVNAVPNPSFSIAVNCESRTIFFERSRIFGDFVRNLGTYSGGFVGFSGYGEQLDFMHLNQSLVLAVFE